MMEMVALYLKQHGRMVSRALSFARCTFEVTDLALERGQARMYDRAAYLWQQLWLLIDVELHEKLASAQTRALSADALKSVQS